MSDFLLLLDPRECPACRHKSVAGQGSSRHCSNCGKFLFFEPFNFVKYEADTGWREYWVWCGEEGWKHRDHLFDDNSKALHRTYKMPELDADYGTQSYLDRKMSQAGPRVKFRKRK